MHLQLYLNSSDPTLIKVSTNIRKEAISSQMYNKESKSTASSGISGQKMSVTIDQYTLILHIMIGHYVAVIGVIQSNIL